ncbi:MAG TPA: response regulator [Alphaproteobacteria bacterium]|nr:response regulator [Alphaproteobacteria bacterium]
MAQTEFQRLNVLVVEDQEMTREITVAILRALGCASIRAAAEGRSAMQMVLDDLPDLIVCDIGMQPMDGFQFVGELQKAGKRIPTIYLTAHSTPEFVKRARQLGVDAYIVKPVKRAVLEERIRHVMLAG